MKGFYNRNGLERVLLGECIGKGFSVYKKGFIS